MVRVQFHIIYKILVSEKFTRAIDTKLHSTKISRYQDQDTQRPRRVHKPVGLMQSVIFVCLFVCLFWVITSKHISHYYVKSIIVHSINNYIFIFYKYTHTLVCYISIIKGCSLGAKSWSFLKTFQTRKQFNYITMHLNISNKKKIKLSLTPNTKLIPTKKTE